MDSTYFRVPMEEFNKALWDRYHNGKIRNVYPFIKYNDIIEKIKAMVANPPCNSPGEYYLLRKFIVVNINGKERLSCKPDGNSENTPELNNPPKYYVALEEIYGVLDDAHKFIKHGCRDRLVRRMQSQGIVNVTRDTAELFLSFCKLCRPRRNQAPRRIANKSPLPNSPPEYDYKDEAAFDHEIGDGGTIMNSSDSNSVDAVGNNNPPHTLCTFTRGFVDILDFSSTPDGDYRHVFFYIDIQTCFCALYPIRCKCVTEMTSHLLNTFTLLGPPQVLHSNFSSPLLHSLVEELKQALPEIILVSGSQNYSELQEVAQNCISEVGCMLKLWMLENSTSNWSRGLKLVQLQKNTKLPPSGSKSPYECFFGHSFYSNLPPTSELLGLKNAVKEDQLLSLINEHISSEPYERLQVSLDPNICELVHTQNQSNMQSFESTNDIVVKKEPASPKETPETNGHELNDSPNGIKASPVHKKSRGGHSCSVDICHNTTTNARNRGVTVRFFSFPKDSATRRAWIHKCHRKDRVNPDSARICSAHFADEDYEDALKAKLLGQVPSRLKETAVPSLLIFSSKKPQYRRSTARIDAKERKELVNELLAQESSDSDSTWEY